MSQAGIISLSSAPLPPDVATSYTTDSGVAVPAANNLNVLATDTTANDNDGINTVGSGSTVTVQLTNRLQGSGSTVGAVTTDLVTFPLGASPGTFTFDISVAGFESTTPASCGYQLFGTIRTDGATATVVGTPDRIANEEAALTACQASLTVSGNNAVIQVLGTAGLTVNFNTVATYVFRGA